MPPAPSPPPPDPQTKGFPTAPEVRDSVYLPVTRSAPPPGGYGLYTVLLARAADRNTVQLLSELFATTGSAGEAVLARENLNLITIPVKTVAEAALTLSAARNRPGATATALMQNSYDFGQAAMLMASLCQPARGAEVMMVCGSRSPEGPLLVTALRPLDGTVAPGQRLLIVNLSTTPSEAMRTVLASYREQILRKDFERIAMREGWRLLALDVVLNATKLLPEISKAYAGTK